MAYIQVNGIKLAYRIFGTGEKTIVITPGGRYSKDTPGVPELGEALAAAGYKVLIWDRPNSGEADICFEGDSDGQMSIDSLAELLGCLEFGPALLIGGSAGSRQSILMALKYPELVRGLFLFWMSGGPIGLAVASMHYCGTSAIAAARGGMEAVAELPIFSELLERNPTNRDRLLSWDRKEFISKMQTWAGAFFPSRGSLLPGYSNSDLSALTMPTMILRGDEMDMFHPRSTSEELHRLIPGSHLAEPVWGENEWERRIVAREERGEPLFTTLPTLAPQIRTFFDTIDCSS
jgi:pimeloyl-ACP methyl ester carboxylesterase